MAAADRTALAGEIRRRGYGDLAGLVDWLDARGIRAGKSAVHLFVKRVRAEDEAAAAMDHLTPRVAEAICEAKALAMATIAAFGRVLDALDPTRPDDPPNS